jgi:anti-anti-sigma factor
MADDSYPVHWAGQQAIVVLPEHIDQSNSAEIQEELLSVIRRGAAALIADLTATVLCDHSGAGALARAYQRAVTGGTDLRLVVPGPAVRRTLRINGIDQLVPVHPSLSAALAAREPTAARARLTVPGGPGRVSADDSQPAATAAADPGTEIALLDRQGVIVAVNRAWRAFAAANHGDPARTGAGVSYLAACAAAGDDPVAREVAAAIRQALAGDLPGPLVVQVPCHGPRMTRRFEMLISPRRDDRGRSLGATVALSLSRPQPRTSPGATPPGTGK